MCQVSGSLFVLGLQWVALGGNLCVPNVGISVCTATPFCSGYYPMVWGAFVFCTIESSHNELVVHLFALSVQFSSGSVCTIELPQ